MNISSSYFLEQMLENPVLLIAVLLTLGVIFVNGWTDAPNAIATCVATRSMPAGIAIFMSAVCNFLGVLVMSLVNTTVAMTIKNMVNFNGDNKMALIALCAAMFAIVVWAVAAWYFGIPTSESHALIAGLSGAATSFMHGAQDGQKFMDVGAVKRLSAINFGVVKEMVLTWILTFPGCGLIGFLMAQLFMLLA